MERVSVISGKLPVIVVAPHGYDKNDENTALIAESIAKYINAYAVINRGWERGDEVDYLKDKADCNNVDHCHEDVVREEFLEPILRFKNRILQEYDRAYVFYIHGMGNKHRKLAGDEKLDIVIGHGAGAPNSFTCDNWEKDLFAHLLYESGICAYSGKRGGPMSGWARSNMNQLFRKWYPDLCVHSMQVEIIYDLRNTKDMSLLTADYLAAAIKDMLSIKIFSSTRELKTY